MSTMTLNKKETRTALQQAGIDRELEQGASLEVYKDLKIVTANKTIKGHVRPCLKVWIGTAYHHSDNNYYFSLDRMNVRIAELKACADYREQQAEERKAKQSNLTNPYHVGDIFHGSWGYDQTNCEYVQVVKVGAKSLTVRAIGAKSVEGSQGFMSELVSPHKDHFIGPEVTVRLRAPYGDGKPGFRIDHAYFSQCSETDSHYSSWYA